MEMEKVTTVSQSTKQVNHSRTLSTLSTLSTLAALAACGGARPLTLSAVDHPPLCTLSIGVELRKLLVGIR